MVLGIGGALVAAVGGSLAWISRRRPSADVDDQGGSDSSGRGPARDLARALASGYAVASPAERACFTSLLALAATVPSTRALTYAREQRRRIRPVRNLSGGDFRVHHQLPGIALAFGAGATGVLTDRPGLKPWLGVPLGVGVGLTIDEAAVLIEREDLYWNSEWLAWAEGLAALGGLAALSGRFVVRGSRALSAGSEADRAVRGYCARERKKVTIKDAYAVSTKDGRPAVRGTCPDCGAAIFRFGRLTGD